MATSSIFSSVKVSDPKKAELLLKALDTPAYHPEPSSKMVSHSFVTDHEKIRKMIEKRKGKECKNLKSSIY